MLKENIFGIIPILLGKKFKWTKKVARSPRGLSFLVHLVVYAVKIMS